MTWQPHITVATIVEDNGRFLMVEELKGGRAVLNQPAGHLDPHETLTEAAVRETLEETGWDVEATGIVGAKWLTRDELIAQRDNWRSELIIRCIDDYLAGHHFSLELIRPSL